jgi:hypothetical protein
MTPGQRKSRVPVGKVTLSADTLAVLIGLSILGVVFLAIVVASLLGTPVGALLVLGLVVAWILWTAF